MDQSLNQIPILLPMPYVHDTEIQIMPIVEITQNKMIQTDISIQKKINFPLITRISTLNKILFHDGILILISLTCRFILDILKMLNMCVTPNPIIMLIIIFPTVLICWIVHQIILILYSNILDVSRYKNILMTKKYAKYIILFEFIRFNVCYIIYEVIYYVIVYVDCGSKYYYVHIITILVCETLNDLIILCLYNQMKNKINLI
jgi:hypothetical protein